MKAKHYRNYVLTNARNRDFQYAWRSRKEFDSITEAKRYAKDFDDAKVYRAYFSQDDGSMVSYREF